MVACGWLWVVMVHLRLVMVTLRARESKMGTKKGRTRRIAGTTFGMDSIEWCLASLGGSALVSVGNFRCKILKLPT